MPTCEVRDAEPAGGAPNLQAQLGGCCAYHPTLVPEGIVDGAPLVLAWYSNASANTGIYLERFDPARLPREPTVLDPASIM